jgi:hypothetical protein
VRVGQIDHFDLARQVRGQPFALGFGLRCEDRDLALDRLGRRGLVDLEQQPAVRVCQGFEPLALGAEHQPLELLELELHRFQIGLQSAVLALEQRVLGSHGGDIHGPQK